jgi:hypothetical protein
MTTAALIVSIISFFAPLENLEDYKWKSIIFYESKYIFLTLYILLIISYTFAFIGLIINFLLFRWLYKSLTNNIKYILILANLIFLISVPLIWNRLGYDISSGVYSYVLPVYASSLVLFGFFMVSFKKASDKEKAEA